MARKTGVSSAGPSPRRPGRTFSCFKALRGAGAASLGGDARARSSARVCAGCGPGWRGRAPRSSLCCRAPHRACRRRQQCRSASRPQPAAAAGDACPARAFPQAPLALADADRAGAGCGQCLDALAALDLEAVRATRTAWRCRLLLAALSPARRRNLLRCWLAGQGLAVRASWLERLAVGTASGGLGCGLAAGCRPHAAALHRGRLALDARGEPSANVRSGHAAGRDRAGAAAAARLSAGQALTLALPGWSGRLHLDRWRRVAWRGPIWLRWWRGRAPGRRAVPEPCGRRAACAEETVQAAGVPAWLRDAPLLWRGERLVCVPALGSMPASRRRRVRPSGVRAGRMTLRCHAFGNPRRKVVKIDGFPLQAACHQVRNLGGCPATPLRPATFPARAHTHGFDRFTSTAASMGSTGASATSPSAWPSGPAPAADGGRSVGDERRGPIACSAWPRMSRLRSRRRPSSLRARHDRLHRRAGLGGSAVRWRCRPKAWRSAIPAGRCRSAPIVLHQGPHPEHRRRPRAR